MLQLVLLIGDVHLPHRSHGLPAKLRALLVPGKMQHVLCTGNLVNRDTLDWLRSIANSVHVVKGDWDEQKLADSLPETKVLTIGRFRIGCIHGHQMIPWGDESKLTQLAEDLDVDVLVSGQSHVASVKQINGRLYVDPGSATGAFAAHVDGPIVPSFALLDVQADQVVVYVYRLQNDEVKVAKEIFKKERSTAAPVIAADSAAKIPQTIAPKPLDEEQKVESTVENVENRAPTQLNVEQRAEDKDEEIRVVEQSKQALLQDDDAGPPPLPEQRMEANAADATTTTTGPPKQERPPEKRAEQEEAAARKAFDGNEEEPPPLPDQN